MEKIQSLNFLDEIKILNGYFAKFDDDFDDYDYDELLWKTGTLGILYFFGYFVYKFIQFIQLMFRYKLKEDDEEVLACWTIAFIAFLVSSVTNPYLASLSGIFVLVMECYILENIIEKYKTI